MKFVSRFFCIAIGFPLFALQAGCAAAFVARPGKVLCPLGRKPDVVAPDLVVAAERIIAARTLAFQPPQKGP